MSRVVDSESSARLEIEPAIREYDRVRLRSTVAAEGQTVADGATGTVLASYENGLALEVEFTAPVHVVVAVPATHLERIRHE